MTTKEALDKLRCLEWTQEVRPGHPWHNQILVNREHVKELLRKSVRWLPKLSATHRQTAANPIDSLH